ncbi:MAG: hypothetical protein GC136_07590 [Alphaproteobacteria bacterium]|nr:hypothetical protein [Alphaproteobacteria bacterium]
MKVITYIIKTTFQQLPKIIFSIKAMVYLASSSVVSYVSWEKLSLLNWALITSLLILIFILFVIASEAQKLQEPELEIQGNKDVSGCIQKTSFSDGSPAIYFRLLVKNIGGKTIKNCTASLIRIQMLGEDESRIALPYGETTPLSWANQQEEKIDLQGQTQQYIDVAFTSYMEVSDGYNNLLRKIEHSRLASKQTPNSVRDKLKFEINKKYILGILFSSDNAASIEKEVLFNWGPTWEKGEITLLK